MLSRAGGLVYPDGGLAGINGPSAVFLFVLDLCQSGVCCPEEELGLSMLKWILGFIVDIQRL